MHIRTALLACALAATMIPAALASGPVEARYSDFEKCSDKTLGVDANIAACTAALQGKLFSSRLQALQLLQNLGAAYLEKGDYDHAFPAFNDAIRLEPKIWQSYANRGVAFLKVNEYQRAIGDFDSLIALKPDYARAFYNRGVAKKALGDTAGADADFAQAAALDAAAKPAQ